MGSIKIIAIGDSVTSATSAKLDVFHDCFQYRTTTVNMVRETQTWRSIMARILSDWVDDGVEVINAGVAGETIAKGAARLERDVLSVSPEYVLVMFGSEDTIEDIEAETFQNSLEEIVNGIADRNARVVLMTPPPISERMTASGCTIYELRQRQEHLSCLAQVVRNLAEGRCLPLVDLHRYFLDNHLAYDHLYEGWLPDGVAQSGMASFIAGELLPMLGVKDFPKPILCDYRKVYSDSAHFDARHSGFTNLIFFDGQFYLGFKSASDHVAIGKGMIIRSSDGISWEMEDIFALPGTENTGRPEFLEVDGRLFVYQALVDDRHNIQMYGAERLGPGRWSQAFECARCCFWHPRKWRDQYVVAPHVWPDKDAAVKLLSSPDGRTWKEVSNILPYETEGNETDLFVENDTLMAFSRAEGGSDFKMLISTYIPSENRWETVSSGRTIQAPCVFKAGERTMVIGRYCAPSDERFRELGKDWFKFTQGTAAESAGVDPARVEEYHHGLRTGIFVMDGTRPRLVMELLSAGDSSYTGVVPYGDEFIISDYSMHECYPEIKRPGDWETPSDIYISRVRFKPQSLRCEVLPA